MSDPVDPQIADAVARFFAARRKGSGLTVEGALSAAGADHSASAVALASKLIAEAARSLGPPSIVGGAEAPPGLSAGADPDALPIIEGYDIIDRIGQGGMGAVFEAYQESTGRRVAVKLMLESLAAGERTRRRFEREVELVARLSHPNIVSVIDSGIHRGRYFYVMEFIEGRVLDHAHFPGEAEPKSALAVLARVADAVEYAHQRGVLHRDLKPANIIVDERGEPHLLDFGLAKSFDPNSLVGVRGSISEPGQFLGTLAYMPPEQARGESERMSVRSDVYALGAIAYHLICGKPPCGLEGALRLVLERINSIEPLRPSALRPGVSRDLDAVLLKALEKEPERRYATAAAFAADLRRLLNDEPVEARRASLARRGWRVVRRHKLAAVVALAVFVVAGSGAGFYAWSIVRENRYYRLAETLDVKRARDMGRLGGQAQKPDITHAMLLDMSARAPEMYAGRPENEAKVRLGIGAEFKRLDSPGYREASAEFTRALDLLTVLHGAESLEAADARFELGGVLYFLGEFEKAQAQLAITLDTRSRLLGRYDSKTIDASMYLAACFLRLGEYIRAEDLYRETLASFRATLQPGDAKLGAPLNNLAACLIETGKFAEAEALAREAMPYAENNPDRDPVLAARAMSTLAACILHQGRAAEALELLDRSIAQKRAQYQRDTVDVARSIHMRGLALSALERRDEALAACEAALAIRREALKPDHPDLAASLMARANLHAAAARRAEAEADARAAREILQSALPADHPLTAESEAILAECAAARGHTQEAETELTRCHAILLDRRGADHPATRRTAQRLSDLRLAAGRS